MKIFIYGLLLFVLPLTGMAGPFPVPNAGYRTSDGDLIWDEVRLADFPFADQIIPAGYTVGPVVWINSNGWSNVLKGVIADGKKTFGELAIQASEEVESRIILATIAKTGCLTYGAGKSPYPPKIVTREACGTAGVTLATCSAGDRALVIDHGIISRTDTFSTTLPVDITCTENMDVRITTAEPSLRLGTGLTSVLSVDGSRDGRLSLKRGRNTAIIRSDLTNTAAAVGEYSASTVLYIIYQ